MLRFRANWYYTADIAEDCGLTAHRPVNAIPIVCAAAPGIRTTLDMAQVIPSFVR